MSQMKLQTRSFVEMWIKRVYTYCRDIEAGMTVFDVGSGPDGAFSLYAVGKGAEQVFAVEPHPQDYQMQTQNFNNLRRFKEQATVPWTGGDVVSLNTALWFADASLLLRFEEPPRTCEISVQATSLDQIVRSHNVKRVDYVKIDTEGCELPIIAGSHQTILRDHPVFAVAAYHNPYFTADGELLREPPPPKLTKRSQMDAVITLFQNRYPEYTYQIKPVGDKRDGAQDGTITFYTD